MFLHGKHVFFKYYLSLSWTGELTRNKCTKTAFSNIYLGSSLQVLHIITQILYSILHFKIPCFATNGWYIYFLWQKSFQLHSMWWQINDQFENVRKVVTWTRNFQHFASPYIIFFEKQFHKDNNIISIHLLGEGWGTKIYCCSEDGCNDATVVHGDMVTSAVVATLASAILHMVANWERGVPQTNWQLVLTTTSTKRFIFIISICSLYAIIGLNVKS